MSNAESTVDGSGIHKGQAAPCSFAVRNPQLQLGRVCRLDHGACFNFCRPELIRSCPTLQAHLRGEPVGATPDLDYPGVLHVIESGPLNDRVLGMPLEHLSWRLRK